MTETWSYQWTAPSERGDAISGAGVGGTVPWDVARSLERLLAGAGVSDPDQIVALSEQALRRGLPDRPDSRIR